LAAGLGDLIQQSLLGRCTPVALIAGHIDGAHDETALG
jgi:hypothetical protein